jgi:hypothetical protein
VIGLIGSQYLSAQLASDLINRPFYLRDIADPANRFCHSVNPVYQMNKGLPRSFLEVDENSLQFSFRVNNVGPDQPLVIMRLNPRPLVLSGKVIIIGLQKFSYQRGTWMDASIKADFGTFDVQFVNGRVSVHESFPFCSNPTIDGRVTPPGATWYVRELTAKIYKKGPNLLQMDYQGFA